MRLYATGVRAFPAWCDRQGRTATLDRPTVAAFVAELLNDSREAATPRALDRYLRLRRQRRLADTSALWLGDRGRGFGYDAMHFTLGRRAEAAGIRGFRPHALRHTARPPLAGRGWQ